MFLLKKSPCLSYQVLSWPTVSVLNKKKNENVIIIELYYDYIRRSFLFPHFYPFLFDFLSHRDFVGKI